MTTYAHDGETVLAVWHGEREVRAEVVTVIEAESEVLDAVCVAMTEVSEALWASYGSAAWFYPSTESDRLGALATMTIGPDGCESDRLGEACAAMWDVLCGLDEAANAVIVAELHGELARVVHAEHGAMSGRAGQLARRVLVATSLNEVLAAHQALSLGGELVGHRHERCVALAHRVRAAVAVVVGEQHDQDGVGARLAAWFGDDVAMVGALLDACDRLGPIMAVRHAAAIAACGVQPQRWHDETWAGLCEVLWRLAERWVADGNDAASFESTVSGVALEATERLVAGVLVDARACWCPACR